MEHEFFEVERKIRVHSFETLATLDGPGLRTVVFMQGCPLRCQFCHNVDCISVQGGEEFETEELVEKLLKDKGYWVKDDSNSGRVGKLNNTGITFNKSEIWGGVTFSGGDPTLQPKSLLPVIKRLSWEGIHIALDTSLFTSESVISMLYPYVDLWMVSIKHLDDEIHKKLTTVSNLPILSNIQYLDKLILNGDNTLRTRIPKIRIRVLILPGITDSKEYLAKLGKYIKSIKNIEKVELLPYWSLGKYKWIDSFGKYELEGVRDANVEDLKNAFDVLKTEISEELIIF